MKAQKVFLFSLWLIAALIGPFTVIVHTPTSSIFQNQIVLINFLQRLLATTAFGLLVSQLILGSNMAWFTNRFGPKLFSWHVVEGLIVYFLLILHPLMQSIIDFKIGGLTNAVFLLLPFTRTYSYDIGKLAFIFLSVAVFAGYFRSKPFLRRNWRKFHILNYIVFYIVVLHSLLLGTDTLRLPFFAFYLVSILIVSGILTRKFVKKYFNKAQMSQD